MKLGCVHVYVHCLVVCVCVCVHCVVVCVRAILALPIVFRSKQALNGGISVATEHILLRH